MKAIPAGTVIQCPGCRAKIGTFKVDLVGPMVLQTNLVAFEPGFEARIGQPMICTCGEPYATKRGFHTPAGWSEDVKLVRSD